ncbi:hypothetical protein B0H21DRAFT_409082 [Amylocystis lapponica]|nr:hypothetical protein B0H21DRAFT_409082 [Amylocystis lapponica]
MWKDHMHFSFLGEHVLFPSLHVESAWTFIVASLLTVLICLSERVLTYAISKHWSPRVLRIRQSCVRIAAWRAFLYWLVTFNRLLYMLISMTFNVGLILVTVTTLAAGQFVIEVLDIRDTPSPADPESIKEPLLSAHLYDSRAHEHNSYPPEQTGRPRSKSKPDRIFIHPNESNIARADAAAMELGISGDTELVKGNNYPLDGDTWQLGMGRDVARELLGR